MGFTDPRDPTAHLTAPAERSESIRGQPFSHPGTVFDWFELGAKAKLIISTAYNTINLLAGEIQSLSADSRSSPARQYQPRGRAELRDLC